MASDIAIFREILSDAAVFVNPRDVDSIAEGIQHIVKDEFLRNRLIGKGDDRAKKYGWQTTARITLQAYEEALREGKRREL